MGDSIKYCDQCENNVGCHLNRECLQLKSLGPPDATACLASFGYQWITPLGKRAFCWTIKQGCNGMMLVGCTYNEETKAWDGESTCDINAALRKPAAGRVPDVPQLRRRLQHLIANEIDYTIRPSGTC